MPKTVRKSLDALNAFLKDAVRLVTYNHALHYYQNLTDSQLVFKDASDDVSGPIDREHQTRLYIRLNQFGLRRVPVKADGNCFFNSVSQALRAQGPVGNGANAAAAADAVIKHDLTCSDIRLKCVEEWQRNLNRYRPFVQNMENDINNFKKDKYFDTDLGDLLPLTVANALNLDIVIICSSPGIQDPIHIYPDEPGNEQKVPIVIYLTFINRGCGHYDYAVPKTT